MRTSQPPSLTRRDLEIRAHLRHCLTRAWHLTDTALCSAATYGARANKGIPHSYTLDEVAAMRAEMRSEGFEGGLPTVALSEDTAKPRGAWTSAPASVIAEPSTAPAAAAIAEPEPTGATGDELLEEAPWDGPPEPEDDPNVLDDDMADYFAMLDAEEEEERRAEQASPEHDTAPADDPNVLDDDMADYFARMDQEDEDLDNQPAAARPKPAVYDDLERPDDFDLPPDDEDGPTGPDPKDTPIAWKLLAVASRLREGTTPDPVRLEAIAHEVATVERVAWTMD